MFNMSFFEMAIIAAVVLIFIGPKELPTVARSIVRFLNQLKRASGEFTSLFDDLKEESNKIVRDGHKWLSETEKEVKEIAEKTEEDATRKS